METNRAPANPFRRLPRLTAVAALAVVATFGSTTSAAAGEYTINACASDRANYSTQAFEDFATRGMASPKGGVGKTTVTFLVGNLLASHLKLRTIAVDVSPSFGTLGRLPAERIRSTGSVVELLRDADQLATAADLRRYVSRLPSGLHVLAAAHGAAHTGTLDAGHYGELVALLSCFYETIVLDLGPGVTGPLVRFARDRSDQVLLVTTADEIAARLTVDAARDLDEDRTAVVVNRAHPRLDPELRAIEEYLRRRGLDRSHTLPDDRRLALMLDTGTYTLEALARPTRVGVKRIGVTVAGQLV